MTRFFRINIMPSDTAFAFTDDEPSGFKRWSYKLSDGEKVVASDKYPPDAHVQMSAEFGMQLGDIIGNTQQLLIVSRALKDEIAHVHAEPVQCLPIAIYNHKKRLASADYFIVNPIGVRDCLDLEESQIEYDDDDEVVDVEEFVLSAPKVEGGPDLFRVKEDPATYIVSEHLARRWVRLDPRPKNVYLDELTVAPGKASKAKSAKKKA